MATLSTTVEIPQVVPQRETLAGIRSWGVAALNSTCATAFSITLHLWVMVALAPAGSPTLWERFLSWDADLYRQVAQNGYPASLTYDPKTGALQGSNLAFSPLYPLLERAAHVVTGSWTGAAITVSWVSMVLCLTLVHKLSCDLYGPSAALPAMVLVGCAQPMAMVFALGYPDGGLYLSLGLAAVLCTRSNHWLWAGVFASLAGVTRPTGVAVVAVVGALAVTSWRDATREERMYSVAGTLLGCFGTPLYLAWVGLRVHRLDAWFAVQQAGWGTHWDSGASFWQFLSTTALHASGFDPLTDLVIVLVVFGYAALTAFSFRRGELGALAVWPVTVMVLALGQSNYSFVKPRLLLAAALCLLPLAKRLAGCSPVARWTLLISASLLSAWWGAYMLDMWHYAF